MAIYNCMLLLFFQAYMMMGNNIFVHLAPNVQEFY